MSTTPNGVPATAGPEPDVLNDFPVHVPKCTKRTHIWTGVGVDSLFCLDCGRFYSYARAAIEKHRER